MIAKFKIAKFFIAKCVTAMFVIEINTIFLVSHMSSILNFHN